MQPIGSPRNSGSQPLSNSTGSQLVVPPGPNFGISQELLAAFKDLREMSRETARIRKNLLDRLDAGATVEPGPLIIELQSYNSQQLSWSVLEATFGAAFADTIRDRIPLSIRRQLNLRNSSSVQPVPEPANGRTRRPSNEVQL